MQSPSVDVLFACLSVAPLSSTDLARLREWIDSIRERIIIIARKWPQHYGGLSAYRSESAYFFRGPLLSPEYTPRQVRISTRAMC